MGILGSIFGSKSDNPNSEGYSDFGTRLALAGQVLMAMDQGKTADISDSLAYLNRQRRDAMEKVKSRKFYSALGAKLSGVKPELGQMLIDENTPTSLADSLVSKYYESLMPKPEDWRTFETNSGDIMRFDANNPNSQPSLFYDDPTEKDPFKRLLQQITPPSTIGSAAAAEGSDAAATTPGVSGSPSPMPGVTSSTSTLTPQLAQLAQTFGLPPDATAEDVMAVVQAGSFSEEQARSTAEAIRQRYKDAKTQGIDLTNKQTENAFRLQDDYRAVAGTYQKLMDTAAEVATMPEDANSYERMAQMYKFIKMLDSAGAVMAADTGLVADAAGPIDRLDQLFKKYAGVSGGDIPADAAKEMKRLILQLGETASKADYIKRKNILKRAKDMGIPADKAEGMIFGSLQDGADALEGYNPRFEVPTDRMTGEQERLKAATVNPANPQAGDVVDGYRFKGGDRKNPANWEEVR